MNNWIKNIGQPIVTLITAILAIIISWKTFWLEGRIKKETHALKTQIELLVQARTELKSERDFYFATLDKVLESIEKGDEDYQTALAALLNAEKQNDRQEGLLQVLASQSPKIKSDIAIIRKESAEYQAAEQNRSYESKATNVLSNGASFGWDLDIFWCEGSNANINKPKAEDVAAYIAGFANTGNKLAGEKIGRIRTRPLAISVNNRPGYRVAGAQIRYDDTENEIVFATNLKNNIFDKGLADFVTLQSKSDTKWYVSLFICE